MQQLTPVGGAVARGAHVPPASDSWMASSDMSAVKKSLPNPFSTVLGFEKLLTTSNTISRRILIIERR
jgi:hypothetical protein